ncbi:probable flavin-containing monooxygenase 1 [Ricinus communis]|uniref:Flavin-containing monooxygenase n=1 Tax=Ricinus communis TaxID=3988 RepID=B9T603_RICCO|nr:probable flavin-containing monooxygenase 1 [Ricinus communis]EEF28718.1 dimethylaniline monooxygenase, putative [Ricinus communis]|eukprot:XP_002533672.1 probable flavin-containing monooxygenase 1 [Ricinus communis]
MEKRVAIIGAGSSGLLSCKYTLEKGFLPVIFEAEERIGGVWTRTIASTKLQNSKETYQFSDFPWSASVNEKHPSHSQVLEYLESYAQHFGIFPYIKFSSKVIGIDYVGDCLEEVESWVLWSGNGNPFGTKGKWHIRVLDVKDSTTKVYQFDFVILCLGLYNGFPNIPDFPPNQGPEVFNGKVMHSMEYSAMDNWSAQEFIKRKRVTIIGSQKSALDIAAECANANGVEYPCTIIQRTAHWFIQSETICGINLGFLYLNRFSEFMIHKPRETYLLSLLTTLLSPLRWGISKFIECYLSWKLPLKKYGMVPSFSFFQDISSCQSCKLPEKFYDRVEEGRIIIRKSHCFSFCNRGLIIDGESQPLETDLVIFATGFKGEEKLRSILESPFFQKCMTGSSTSRIPLYRQVIHPRIPQLAILGYAESLSNLCATEIRCQWLAQFLDRKFELPSISEMEKQVSTWENFMKQHTGNSRRACISTVNIWNNDQICKDMGCEPRRKEGFFADLFVPYGPTDYAGLSAK